MTLTTLVTSLISILCTTDTKKCNTVLDRGFYTKHLINFHLNSFAQIKKYTYVTYSVEPHTQNMQQDII